MQQKPRPTRRAPYSRTTIRLDWAAHACYNQIDTSNRREFRRIGSGRPTARGGTMKNPLDSLWGTVISCLFLTVILYFVVKSILS